MQFDCNNHVASFNRAEAPCDKFCPLTNDALGIPEGEYTFVFTYPLSTEARFTHKLSPSTSLIDILELAQKDYKEIYAAEEAETGDSVMIPGMLNRAQSFGKYGIWGHVLEDLYFEGVKVDDTTIRFLMGS